MKNFWKKYPKLLIFIISLPLLFLILRFLFIVLVISLGPQFITWRFNSEVKNIPEIKIKEFSVFEGVGFARVDIEGKGEMALMYGLKGLGEIRWIGKFNTGFNCHDYPYIYVKYLNFRKDSPFSKHMSSTFPFKVNNLKDLVAHYDDITKVLENFPWDNHKDDRFSYPIQDKEGKTTTCYLKNDGVLFNWPTRLKK